ncbi:di-heme oxidoredictase family protein [Pseudolabrys sp. FHR47]|uniref:di-heme oxidoredictase family protein n=1 Tax=Pseudolabrys sp. FHR47 TaxID=2562284 RepID=UPI00143DB1E6|nr:di-heme oxidoredictase family protein [Pseudolabrys sp. FHR47]
MAVIALLSCGAGSLSGAEPDMAERGRAVFHAQWVPPGTAGEFMGLGPVFNTNSCASCHVGNGRGAPARADDRANTSLVVKLAAQDNGAGADTIRRYGNRLNYRAVDGVPAEGELMVSFEAIEGRFADGEHYTLQKPIYGFDKLGNGAVEKDTFVAVRMAPPIMGLGLLEKVPEDWVRARAAANAASAEPVKGRPNAVWDSINFRMTLGRFGWKADAPNLTRIIAAAFITDMGLTSRLFPSDNCGELQAACKAAAAPSKIEVNDATLAAVTQYVASLSPPRPGAEVERGTVLFASTGCTSCHVSKVPVTLADGTTNEIAPYTDLLLHDMGEGLADGMPEAAATGREWRTAPLWGLGEARRMSDRAGYLHDGRARSITEAILWHGGEAQKARENFVRLDAASRASLLKFLDQL